MERYWVRVSYPSSAAQRKGVIECRLHLPVESPPSLMALRPNTNPFTPGTGGSQPSATLTNKQSSFINSSTQSPTPSSTTTSQSIPNKTPSRPPAKTKGLPRGNQGKRTQSQRKSEKKGRFTDEALISDPLIETVFLPFRTWMGWTNSVGIGYVWSCKPTRTDFVESSLEFLHRPERLSSLLESFNTDEHHPME